MLQCLPLKEDFEENDPVYSCIIELFSDQHPLIRQYLAQILAVFSQVLPSGNLQEGMKEYHSATEFQLFAYGAA